METKEVSSKKKGIKKKNRGASLVEYALLAALIAVVCILAIRAIGTKASKQFSGIASNL